MRGETPITRMLTQLSEMATAPLRIVVAPAGYGKTTLLRQLAARLSVSDTTVPIWYTATAAEVSPSTFVHKLASAFGATLGGHATRITQLDTLLDRLRRSDRDFTVFVDDAHLLAGRPAADAMTQLLNEAPPTTRFVVATRSATTPAIPRRTSIRPVYRIDHRDLRLRPWETELLFRSVYGRPITPETAAALCAWTEGWPAALDLVHLDTAPRAGHDELADTGWTPRLSPQAGDQLVRQVLGPVPAQVRDVMVRMSALGVLSGGLCDALLERTDSAWLLRKLAENQVLTWPSERDGTCYRFHRLLQRYLEDLLAERLGPDELRAWYRRAAEHLIRFGHWPEACRAYAHAEDWVAVGEILHHRQADDDGLSDAAIMPKALLDGDSWLTLAHARRLRADGDLVAACQAYEQARAGFDQPGPRWQCAAERAAIARWLGPPGADEPPQPRGTDLSSAVFEAVHGHPGRLPVRARRTDDPNWRLACAVAAVLDGRCDLAAELLAEPMIGESSFVSLAGRLLATVVAAGTHRPPGTTAACTALALEAETAGWPWLARLARAATAVADPMACPDALLVRDECAAAGDDPMACPDALLVRDECAAAGDDWGALLAGALLAAGTIRAGADAEPPLRQAIAIARRLGATVPELWLHALFAEQLARRHDPAAAAERAAVRAAAESAHVPRAASHAPALAATLLAPPPIEAAEDIVPVLIRCLGPYEFLVNGTRLDLSGLRPQARLLLRLLSLRTVAGIRDEKLIAAIWPDTPAATARHRLHVALSSLRRLLRRQTAPLPVDVVRREDAYVLSLPAGSQVDLVLFDAAVHRWRAAGRDESVQFGLRALALYRGDLLGADPGTDLAAVERERLRTEAATVVTMLAAHARDHGDMGTVVRLCQRGLQIDELNEQLWCLMAEAQRRTGNEAAARRALRTYADLFADGARAPVT